MKNISWQKILDKEGTILVDRRLRIAVVTILAVLLGVPELVGTADAISPQAADWIVLLSSISSMILVPLGLTLSWAKRPPSGLDYKEITVTSLIETAKKNK